MAQALQNIAIQAPAFQGINTEDSPLSQDPTYAQRSNNAVLDSFGRLGARKGFREYASSWDFSAITPPASWDSYVVTTESMAHSEGERPLIGLSVQWFDKDEISLAHSTTSASWTSQPAR